jgi:hypothetical protein
MTAFELKRRAAALNGLVPAGLAVAVCLGYYLGSLIGLQLRLPSAFGGLASQRHAHGGAPVDPSRSMVDRAGGRAAGAPGGSTADRMASAAHRRAVLHQLLRSADRRGRLPVVERRNTAIRYVHPPPGVLPRCGPRGSADLFVRRRRGRERGFRGALLAGVALPVVRQHPGGVDGCARDHRGGG